MANYDYTAVAANGKEKKGSMEAANADKVREALKAEGLVPITIKEQNILSKDINISIGASVKSRDLSVFCRQFGSIINAGVTVVEALQMLYEQTENKSMKNAIREVMRSVEKGESLAEGMRSQEKIFPQILVNMVEAGEASGKLEISFERMAVHFEKDAKLKALVKKAMIYPVVICVVAIGVIIIMMTFVIPNFMGMFEELDQELPGITLLVIGISNFMVAKWWLLLLIVAGLIAAVIYFKGTDAGRMFFGKLALKLPAFGNLTTKSSSARLTRTLSTLLTAGLPLIDAIDITARTIDNEIVKRSLMDAKDEVARGIPLSQPLEASGLFPPMVFHMMRIGEETGNIEGMLDKVADYYDEEVENATEALTAVMEPLIIVILAVVVGTIIMAIMSPMLGMYSAIENQA